MTMQRWDPFAELRRLENVADRLRSSFTGARTTGDGEVEGWAIPLDVFEEGDKVKVQASMPGVSPENVKVSIEDDVLTIRGETAEEHEVPSERYYMRERRAGAFYRALRLPDTVDQEKITSEYRNGVLTVTLPKRESEGGQQIEVE